MKSMKSLMAGIDLSTRNKVLRNTECQTTLHPNNISLQSFAFQSDVLLLNSRGVEAVRKCKVILAQRTGGAVDFLIQPPLYCIVSYSGHDG